MEIICQDIGSFRHFYNISLQRFRFHREMIETGENQIQLYDVLNIMRPKYEKCISEASNFFDNIMEKRISQALTESKPSDELEQLSYCSHSAVSEAFDNNYDHDLCPHDVIDLDLLIEDKSTET